MERPDLSGVSPDVLAYIEALEDEVAAVQEGSRRSAHGEAPLEPTEPPTTINVISISASGMAKRTPRHFYARQRRGGMGVFDLDSDEDDPPKFLLTSDESAGLILVTNQARVFRIAVNSLPESPVRSRGQSILEGFPLRPQEQLALIFADEGGSYVELVSQRGQVRRIAGHYFGSNLQPGTVLYDVKEGGPPAAACWTTGGGDLVLVTRQGKGIRFAEKQVPIRGCLGMRVERDDEIMGVAGVSEEGGVFMLTDDGKGTIRLMAGFSANKAPGSGGKVLMKADNVIGAATVSAGDDVFVISRLGKIIRFAAAEVPPKEGVVQGVNCMALRADECVALGTSFAG